MPRGMDAVTSEDPPVLEQLAPLPTAELERRAIIVQTTPIPHTREALLCALVTRLESVPRPERLLAGKPVPPHLLHTLLSSLRSLKWPSRSQRPGVNSEQYLVLSTQCARSNLGTRHPHFQIRSACDELVKWYREACDDPEFVHTAIAVTKNFAGSPHIDAFDRCPQLALALGDFSGGALCVEGEGGESLDVFDTHGRVAKVDGRRVHWVRAFRGGDRYSLIWYNTVGEGDRRPPCPICGIKGHWHNQCKLTACAECGELACPGTRGSPCAVAQPGAFAKHVLDANGRPLPKALYAKLAERHGQRHDQRHGAHLQAL